MGGEAGDDKAGEAGEDFWVKVGIELLKKRGVYFENPALQKLQFDGLRDSQNPLYDGARSRLVHIARFTTDRELTGDGLNELHQFTEAEFPG